MENKNLFRVNFILFIGLILVIALVQRGMKATSAVKGIGHLDSPKAHAAVRQTFEAKDAAAVRPAAPEGPPKSLKEMYQTLPKEDVGDNMFETWSAVSPENKAKFVETLDKQITESKELLKSNPEDEKAKSLLFISEALKRMAADNFDHAIKGPSAKDGRQK